MTTTQKSQQQLLKTTKNPKATTNYKNINYF